jgi:DNA replication protein DnaC
MINTQSLDILNRLKLFGIAASLQDRLASAAHQGLANADFLALLLQDEQLYRENKRLKRLLANAKFKLQASIEEMDFLKPRGLTKQLILDLAAPHWIDAARNVLITGPTGVGKTFIACALGNAAARVGYPVLYFRAPRLFESLLQSRADGSHLKYLAKLAKARVLIIDDFLLVPLQDRERRDCLEIIEDRYGSAATVITSQCPPHDWHHNIGDPTIADAICDRLFHNASKIILKGDSFRKKQPAS